MPKASEPARAYGRALLDVNVLIALLDAGHVHHELAAQWLEEQLAPGGWASCPITQIGCIRVMSQPAYPGSFQAAAVASRLSEACADPSHTFWPDDVVLTGSSGPRWDHVLGHRQVTDLYLLAMAVRHGGRLVTFDRRISIQAVPGAVPSQLCVIAEKSGS